MSKLRALNDKVILQTIEDGETQYGNIIIPDLGKERPEKGVVVGVGPGRETEYGILITPKVKEGDVVLVPKFSAQNIQLDGESYIVCRDSDILVVIESN